MTQGSRLGRRSAPLTSYDPHRRSGRRQRSPSFPDGAGATPADRVSRLPTHRRAPRSSRRQSATPEAADSSRSGLLAAYRVRAQPGVVGNAPAFSGRGMQEGRTAASVSCDRDRRCGHLTAACALFTWSPEPARRQTACIGNGRSIRGARNEEEVPSHASPLSDGARAV